MRERDETGGKVRERGDPLHPTPPGSRNGPAARGQALRSAALGSGVAASVLLLVAAARVTSSAEPGVDAGLSWVLAGRYLP